MKNDRALKGFFTVLMTIGFLLLNGNLLLMSRDMKEFKEYVVTNMPKEAEPGVVAENLALQLENGVLKLQIEDDERIYEENERLKAQNEIFTNLFKNLPKDVIDDIANEKDVAVVKLEKNEPIAAYVSATAYTAAPDECSRSVNDPDYGRTASGDFVEEWLTVASNDLSLGTRVYIPYFKDEENGGVFIVKDRMPEGYTGAIDIYMTTKKEAFEFGRQKMTVYILPDE